MRKFKHPMAILRFVLGEKNQAQFAKELGVTKSLIDKIERKERKITPQLKVVIKSLYGGCGELLEDPILDPTDALEMREKMLTMWLNYTGTWMRVSGEYNTDAPASFKQYVLPVIEDLIEKAQRKNNTQTGHKAVALLLSLENWIRDAAENFGLGPVPRLIYANGDILMHSSGKHWPPRGFYEPLERPPMPEYIHKAAQAYLDEYARSERAYWGHVPEPAKAEGKPAGKAKGKTGTRRASRKPRRA